MDTRIALKLGHRGQFVSFLQLILAMLGYNHDKLIIDGDFGEQTEVAVRLFQIDRKIPSNGIFGEDEWHHLKKQFENKIDFKEVFQSLIIWFPKEA